MRVLENMCAKIPLEPTLVQISTNLAAFRTAFKDMFYGDATDARFDRTFGKPFQVVRAIQKLKESIRRGEPKTSKTIATQLEWMRWTRDTLISFQTLSNIELFGTQKFVILTGTIEDQLKVLFRQKLAFVKELGEGVTSDATLANFMKRMNGAAFNTRVSRISQYLEILTAMVFDEKFVLSLDTLLQPTQKPWIPEVAPHGGAAVRGGGGGGGGGGGAGGGRRG